MANQIDLGIGTQVSYMDDKGYIYEGLVSSIFTGAGDSVDITLDAYHSERHLRYGNQYERARITSDSKVIIRVAAGKLKIISNHVDYGIRCECGGDKSKCWDQPTEFVVHSNWCPKYRR
jgi:hypothetical protein